MNLQETFEKVFGDNPAKVRFNANSIRKYWERRWLVIQKEVSDGVSKAHFAQTAHSKKTAEENFLDKNGSPEDRNILFATYAKDLDQEASDQEEAVPAPPDEVFDESDLDEEITTSTPQHAPKPKPPPQPVARFNAFRNSLQNETVIRTPQIPPIVASRNRESLNSTIESVDTPRRKYLASLRSFRVKPNRPIWTEEEKKACLFFEDYPYANRTEVEKRILECGVTLTSDAYDRIWAKIKTARQVLKK